MKTFIALSLGILLWLIPASRSSAAVVSWGFSGVVDRFSNSQGKLPANIAVGTPFTGVVRYDTSLAVLVSPDPNPNSETYAFASTAGYSITLHIAGHIISSTNSIQASYRTITVENDINDQDYLSFEEAHETVSIDGKPISGPITTGGLGLGLRDPAKTMLTNESLPSAMPQLVIDPESSFVFLNAFDAGGNVTSEISGEIMSIYPEGRVVLTTQKISGTQLRLSWPVSATGLTLQYATSLTTQDWTTEPTAVVDTATEHTVTVSTTGQPKFFRLVKLP